MAAGPRSSAKTVQRRIGLPARRGHSLDPPRAPEQRKPIRDSVNGILPGHWLIPDADRQMRHVDPALELNVGGNLFLCREVRRIEPCSAEFLDPRTVGPAEPRLL